MHIQTEATIQIKWKEWSGIYLYVEDTYNKKFSFWLYPYKKKKKLQQLGN